MTTDDSGSSATQGGTARKASPLGTPSAAGSRSWVVTLLLGALIGVLIGLVIGQEPEIRAMLGAKSNDSMVSSGISGGAGPLASHSGQPADASSPLAAPSEPAKPKRGAEQLRVMESLNKAMARIAALPSLSVAPPAVAPAASADAVANDSGLLAFVNRLFQVRRTDQAAHAFYSTEVYQVSREQIRLRLLSARVSVQLDDIPMALEDVIAARQQMVRIFDRQIPDVESVVGDLNQIEADLRRLL
ncbi:MAG: HemX, putative uroporphyrinogen-III C-methyltransferase [Pseudomonadota bacterium]